MLETNSLKSVIYGLLLIGLAAAVLFIASPSWAKPNAPTEPPTWETAVKISNSTHGARNPIISHSPVSDTVLLVYDNWQSSDGEDRDPFFAISTNNGTAWSAGQVVITTTGKSVQPIGILDRQDTGYTFWIEQTPSLWSLVYSSLPAANSSWSIPAPVYQKDPSAGLILDPNVTVDHNNTLHLVWSVTDFADSGKTNLWYAQKPQGGAWSTPVEVKDTGPTSREPSVTVDKNGLVHIVWEEETEDGGTDIRYVRGHQSGSGFVIDPSGDYRKLNPESVLQATLPTIHASGNQVFVTYTNLVDSGDDQLQDVYYGNCSLPCRNLDATGFRSVSGAFVTVNSADPFNLASNFDYDSERNAGYIYFHGIQTDTDKEAVIGVNSCDGWGGGSVLRDVATDPNTYRAIDPSIAVKSDFMQLAYDRIDGSDHQIYVVRGSLNCDALVYLPVIHKQ